MAPSATAVAGNLDLGLFFLIGLLGGAHCIGMCGPLVMLYSGRLDGVSEKDGRDRLSLYEVRQHGLFNIGRTVSYSVIGGLFGLLGSVLYIGSDTVGELASAARGSVGVVIGVFVIAVGVYYTVGRTGDGPTAYLPGLGFGRVHDFLMERVDRWVGGAGIMGMGAVHGLLPCPILYPAFLYAFSTGSPVRGILSLGALGVGTIPAVFLYGTVIESVDVTKRRRLHRVLGLVFIALGYIPLSMGLVSFGVDVPRFPVDIPFYQPLG